MRLHSEKLKKKLSPFFNAISGKDGTRVAVGTVLAIVTESAAISFAIAAAVGALPSSAFFFAGGLLGTGAGFAVNAANSISQHKNIKKIKKLEKKILTTEEELLEEKKKENSAPAAAQPVVTTKTLTAKAPTAG